MTVKDVNIGDIVQIKYLDFDNNERVGMFLVYSKDSYWLSNLKSFSTIKVCTNPLSYQVELDYKFLDHTSYANCSSFQRFRVDQVYKILGHISTKDLIKVRKQLKNFSKDVDKQLESAINLYTNIEKTIKDTKN